MKKIRFKRIAATILGSSMILAMGLNTACVPTELIEAINSQGTKNVVKSTDIRPQDDFYGYVNAEYLMSQDVTVDYNVGTLDKLQSNTTEMLVDEILRIGTSDEEYVYGSKEDIIRKAFLETLHRYDEGVFEKSAEEKLPEVNKVLADIENAATPEELMLICLENGIGIRPALFASVNPINPTEFAIVADTLGSIIGANIKSVKEYINNIDESKSDYLRYAKKMGIDEDKAKEEFRAIEYVAVEICWATPDWALIETSNPADGATFVSSSELEQIFTNMDYRKLEEKCIGRDNPYGGWIVYSVEQLKAINDAYTMDNLEALKNWATFGYWQIYEEVIDYGNGNFSKNDVEIPTELEAARSIAYDQFFAEEISMLYVDLVYDEESDECLRSLIDDVIDGYSNKINNAEWLSDEAKELLNKKLDNIVVLTARDVDSGKINEAKADCFTGMFASTHDNLEAYMYEDIKSQIGAPVPKDEISMPMNEVNAAYSQNNVITILLAICQGDVFDKDNSYAQNLGGIGTVIAHEIGHAFDSDCMGYDYEGIYNPEWLPVSDREALKSREEAVIDYFETTFTVGGIYRVDGEQTLGENLADLSGVEVCVSLLNEDEEYQIFFEEYAKVWSELMSAFDIAEQIDGDVHSPGILRVNAILANIDEFIELYDIKEGDGMYIPQEKLISRWN